MGTNRKMEIFIKGVEAKKTQAPAQREKRLGPLSAYVEKNLRCYPGVERTTVTAKLEASPVKLWSLQEMEKNGGGPDEVAREKKAVEFILADCPTQSREGNTGVGYDCAALDARKEPKPKTGVMDGAAAFWAILARPNVSSITAARSLTPAAGDAVVCTGSEFGVFCRP